MPSIPFGRYQYCGDGKCMNTRIMIHICIVDMQSHKIHHLVQINSDSDVIHNTVLGVTNLELHFNCRKISIAINGNIKMDGKMSNITILYHSTW